MKRLDTHEGKRSWWNGKVKTLCGQTLPSNTRYILFGKATCDTCRRLKRAGKK